MCSSDLVLPGVALAQGEHIHEPTTTAPTPSAPSGPRPAGERVALEAVRATGPVRIDGMLDESVWKDAHPIDAFVQQEPLEGQPATDRTDVRVLYDEGHLYIGVHAFSSLPVAATEMRRDADRLFDEDNFQVILDTFHDSRNGYMFLTSPLGAKLEQQVFDEGEGGGRGTTSNVNRNWDGVWDATARIVDDGWTAEISIPFSTVRFVPRDDQTWGVNFQRFIRRKNETVLWAPIPRAYSLTRVSLAGELVGCVEVYAFLFPLVVQVIPRLQQVMPDVALRLLEQMPARSNELVVVLYDYVHIAPLVSPLAFY